MSYVGRLRAAGVLGMNRRNAVYTLRWNPRRFYPRVDDKLETKRLLREAGIPTAPWCRFARPRERRVGSRVIDITGTPRWTITRTSGTPSVVIATSSGCTSSRSSANATSGCPPSAYAPEMMLAE